MENQEFEYFKKVEKKLEELVSEKNNTGKLNLYKMKKNVQIAFSALDSIEKNKASIMDLSIAKEVVQWSTLIFKYLEQMKIELDNTADKDSQESKDSEKIIEAEAEALTDMTNVLEKIRNENETEGEINQDDISFFNRNLAIFSFMSKGNIEKLESKICEAREKKDKEAKKVNYQIDLSELGLGTVYVKLVDFSKLDIQNPQSMKFAIGSLYEVLENDPKVNLADVQAKLGLSRQEPKKTWNDLGFFGKAGTVLTFGIGHIIANNIREKVARQMLEENREKEIKERLEQCINKRVSGAKKSTFDNKYRVASTEQNKAPEESSQKPLKSQEDEGR